MKMTKTPFGNPTVLLTILVIYIVSAFNTVQSQEAQWIWHPNWKLNQIPKVTTYYRKTFRVDEPEQAEILIAADDKYELFVNSKKVGSGTGTESLDRYNVSQMVKKGKNLIAVRAQNLEGTSAAMVARVQVKDRKGWRSFSTDGTWKTSNSPLPIWKMQFYNDASWRDSQVFGKLGSTKPWDRPAEVVNQDPQKIEKEPNIQQAEEEESEFVVEEVIEDEQIGSIIAFEFNEFGKIIAALETGGLVILDPNSKSQPRRPRYLTKEISAVQGILPLNGDIYVTGIYANNLGLYKLVDNDADESIDEIIEILAFKGYPGEHGSHGLALGTDGNIYVSVGNHVSYAGEVASNSPYRNYYEGTIVKRYEDPGGHAKGIRAPGGTILRTDLDGTNVEIFAGGIRNAYDLAFTRSGELFTYDSDMETDKGMSWYRPTQFLHVTAGGEYGWRSGWGKWPSYYMDGLPAVTDTGRGSPTGVTIYDHNMYPVRYHGTFFVADWSGGKIYNIKLTNNGASFKAEKELFVEGSPLNVTDLSVGPDGALYFSTGGRMTSGGIFKVRWKGEVPEKFRLLSDNLSKIIRQPQPQSAFSRQKLAELRSELGTDWDTTVLGVALSPKNPANYRLHAIDLMMLYGPVPSSALLVKLSKDTNVLVRAKVARAMAYDPTPIISHRLVEMLGDESPQVRRIVCEGIAYRKIPVRYEDIQPLLKAADRFESLAARKVLEKMAVADYREEVLNTKDQLEFIRGSLALIAANPDPKNSYAILARVSELLEDFISDRNFLEMLRLVQVAIELGEIEHTKIPAFTESLTNEFPSGNALMNRELTKILANLQADGIVQRGLEYLKTSTISNAEKVEIAMHLQLIEEGWTSSQKYQLIDFLETQIRTKIEGNFSAFIRIVVREFAKRLTPEESIVAIKRGKSWPNAAMSAFYKLPKTFNAEMLATVKDLDQSIREETEETYDYIRKGIIAVLAQSGGKSGNDYLKEIWRRDPERRKFVAIALTLNPNTENWPYLVASIKETDEEAAEVMNALAKVPQKPSEGKYYRMVIVKALKANNMGKLAAMNLLEYWTGVPTQNKFDPDTGIQGWQTWFTTNYPDEAPAELNAEPQTQKWTVDLVLEVLASAKTGERSKENGRSVFKQAQCSNCHRFQNFGDSLGPDLTTVSRRFTTREIIESIIHPNDVISDQYRSEIIETTGGRQLTGIISPGPDNSIMILDNFGKKTLVGLDAIEERSRSRTSIMPSNLLEKLTQQEVIDLFAYLGLQDKDRIAEKRRFRTR